eukprot:14701438-Alexandrium_andersonii.AAC.1
MLAWGMPPGSDFSRPVLVASEAARRHLGPASCLFFGHCALGLRRGQEVTHVVIPGSDLGIFLRAPGAQERASRCLQAPSSTSQLFWAFRVGLSGSARIFARILKSSTLEKAPSRPPGSLRLDLPQRHDADFGSSQPWLGHPSMPPWWHPGHSRAQLWSTLSNDISRRAPNPEQQTPNRYAGSVGSAGSAGSAPVLTGGGAGVSPPRTYPTGTSGASGLTRGLPPPLNTPDWGGTRRGESGGAVATSIKPLVPAAPVEG